MCCVEHGEEQEEPQAKKRKVVCFNLGNPQSSWKYNAASFTSCVVHLIDQQSALNLPRNVQVSWQMLWLHVYKVCPIETRGKHAQQC